MKKYTIIVINSRCCYRYIRRNIRCMGSDKGTATSEVLNFRAGVTATVTAAFY